MKKSKEGYMSRGKSVLSYFADSFKRLFARNGKGDRKTVCFVYYQHFNALIYREAKTLLDQGLQADIIILRRTRREKIFQSYGGMNIYAIQARSSAERSAISYFWRLLLFYIKATVLLTYLMPERRYSVVHVTAPPDVMVFSAIIPKLLGARIILDIHDIGPELFMRKLNVGEDRFLVRVIKLLERLSAAFADHVITVTDFWKDKLAERSVRPSKLTMLLNVPDNELFRPVGPRHARSSFNLFYHGSIEEHFGLDTLLTAMPAIKDHIPRVLLHLYCGKKGRIYADCTNLIKKLKLGSYVMFHEAVPFYELPHTLSSADMGIVPTKDSVFSNEAVSMKALEYISMEIPIVISKTKAHAFYYDNSMVKFFEPCNSEELARAVVDLFDNAEERATLVKNASAFMKEHGWNKSKEIYSKIVNDLIAGRQ